MMQTIGLCTQNDSFVYSKPYVCDFQINGLYHMKLWLLT